MAETVSIYESIGRNLGDIYAKGVPTNCTASTFESNVLIHPNAEQLRGKEVFWYSGAGAGQSRIVASYAPANNRIIHDRKFDTIPSSNSRFLIFKGNFRVEDYENAMNRAIGQAKLRYLDNMVATMQIAGSQYEYPVPSGMEYIHRIRLVPSGNTDYAADDEVDTVYDLHHNWWDIEQNPLGSYVIVFDPRKVNLNSIDEEYAHIHGQAKPDFSGTTVADEVQEFVIAHSSMQLAAQQRDQEWRSLFYMYRDEVKGREGSPGLEEYIFRTGRGKKVR